MRSLLVFLVSATTFLAASTPAQAAWLEAKSKHFIIYSDDQPERVRALAERLERFDQAVRWLRSTGDPALTDSQRLTIYMLPSEGAVGRLAGSYSVSGLYRARASGAAAFVPRKAGSKYQLWDLDAESIFFHEYAHHLQLQFASVAILLWMSEGFAEFFATAQIRDDGSVVIGNPPQHRSWGLFDEDRLSIRQVVGSTYRDLDGIRWESLYGIGWLLTHYLTFEPSRRGQLQRYAEGIHKGMTALAAAEAAFGDLRTLERELERYKTSNLRGLTVDAGRLSTGTIAIRPLRPGEAGMMDVHIRSTRGVNKKKAREVAADARRVAAQHQNDPFVMASLAEAELDAGNFAAAESAADRALAADPKNIRALIFKGRARMELAKASPGTADWNEIRRWFVKANRLDTENAEPLMLFYETYLHAGAQPTKNAVEGLLYAAALAPQDDSLRLAAVRRLLVENRLAEARTMFAPIAFQPHTAEKWRTATGKTMEAISGGDGKSALTALDAVDKLVSEEEDED